MFKCYKDKGFLKLLIMILLAAHQGLVDFLTVVFIICGIGLVIAAVIDNNALMRSIGFPTWKEWWKELKKH